LTSPQVILSIIMLAAMVYMVIIPLYRMVRITITYSEKDLRYAEDAVVGAWTAFHWIRMMSGRIGQIMLYQPMMHSMVVSLGATLLSLGIGGSLPWPGRWHSTTVPLEVYRGY
jgi:iron(III) transport system permease protein